MIKVCENKEHNILISDETHISLSEKNHNESFPNIKKNIFQIPNLIPFQEISLKTAETNSFKNNSTNPSIEVLTKSDNNFTNIINLSGKIKDNKDYIEKKRKRKNKFSYSSNNSNKKPKNKTSISPIINLSNKVTSKNINQSPIKENKPLENELNLSNGAIKFDPSIKKEQKEIEKTSKKKQKISEKERIAKEEKEFMEKLNKEYPDEQYKKDLDINLKEEKAKFMQKNFPIMYRKDKYYIYNVLLHKRRTQPIHFINPNSLNESIQESKKNQTLYLNEEPELFEEYSLINNEKKQYEYDPKKIILDFTKDDNQIIQNSNQKDKNKEMLSDVSSSEYEIKNLMNHRSINNDEESNKFSGLKFKKLYSELPKHIWSKPDDERSLDIDLFYDECIEIWPFNECTFVKEIALEFLMKNNYSIDMCLNRIKDFVAFMKKRANELNISIVSEKEKNIKNYCLRKTKYN